MFGFDPIFSLLGIIGMGLVFIPQMIVKSTYEKFSKVAASGGLTGGEIAKLLLNIADVHNVDVEPTQGILSDHYDPSKKVVRLSQDIYYGKSVSAVSIAAHEVGHAIQDNTNYIPMRLRAGVFPLVQTGQFLGPILLMAGLGLRFMVNLGGLTDLIAITGILLYGSVVVFHIVTLPVEFNASFRAIRVLADGGYIVDKEISGAKQVLTAAAFTYIATALYALMELVYWVWTFFGRKDD